MKTCLSIFLLLVTAAPAAMANSTSILDAQPKKPQFINYQVPSGTAVLVAWVGPHGNPRWDMRGEASSTLYTFTFHFYIGGPYDFYGYGPLSLIGNGVGYRGTIIHVHIDSTGLLTGGWTGPSNHGRLILQFANNGTGCSTDPTAQCLTITGGTFAVATTPEPGSLALITTGIVAIAGVVRRRMIARVL